MKVKLIYLIHVCCIITLFFTCTKKTELQDESDKILVQIADRTITVSDFIKRSEFTLRPFYCRGNTEKDKRIILNSLIAEKLLALEADDSPEPVHNNIFKAYIKGRKEQLMRDKLFEIEATSKIKLDDVEIESAISKTGMEYEVEYINLDLSQAEFVQKEINERPDSIQSLFDAVGVSQIHTVRYLDNDLSPISQALFTNALPPGHIVAPLQLDPERYIFMRIKNYTNRPTVSGSEMNRKRQLEEATGYRTVKHELCSKILG